MIFAESGLYQGKADIVLSHITKANIKVLFTHLRTLKKPKMVLISAENGYADFLTFFKTVEAGGGGVFNPKGELLLIHRLGNWDLPKGKLDKGETAEAGALREVEEECNVHALSIVKKLEPTLHIYFQKKWLIKKTHWFVMRSEKYKNAKPQYEEDIDDVKWVRINVLDIDNTQTYTSIREVLRALKQYSEDSVHNSHHEKLNLE